MSNKLLLIETWMTSLVVVQAAGREFLSRTETTSAIIYKITFFLNAGRMGVVNTHESIAVSQVRVNMINEPSLIVCEISYEGKVKFCYR